MKEVMILQTVDRFDQTNINVQENSNLIWNIANNILPTRDNVLER